MSIIGKKRILALLAALMLILLAVAPSMAESAGEEPVQTDKLYIAIDENGYAYVTAAENTIFYSDETLTQATQVGLLRRKVTLTATAYIPEGTTQIGVNEADDTPVYAEGAVLVWLSRGGEPESFYIPRSAVKNPLKETSIVSQAQKAGLSSVPIGAARDSLLSTLRTAGRLADALRREQRRRQGSANVISVCAVFLKTFWSFHTKKQMLQLAKLSMILPKMF